MNTPHMNAALKDAPHMNALHQRSIVIDGLIIAKWDRSIFEDMRRGGLSAASCTVSVWEGFEDTVANIADMKALIRDCQDLAILVRTAEDIPRAKREGKVGVILSFQNAHACEDHLGHVEAFADMGVRVIQLCYNTQNLVGTGCYERDGGLSGYGQELIREMNRVGIMVDLSHVGGRTSREAILASTRPVCYSHCAPLGLKEHPRNKSDDELRFIADHGGFVGVTMFPPFLRRGVEATVDDYGSHRLHHRPGRRRLRGRGHGLHPGLRQGLLRLDHARQGPLPQAHGLRSHPEPGGHSHHRRISQPDRRHGARGLARIAHRESHRRELAARVRRSLGGLIPFIPETHMHPQVPIDVDEKTGVWTTDALPMLYVPRHFLVNNHEAVEQALGREAYAAILYAAGHKSAYYWCDREARQHGIRGVDVFAHYLTRISQRGWGQFSIAGMDPERATADIALRHSAFVLQAHEGNGKRCHMFAGWFAGAMDWVSLDSGSALRARCQEAVCAGEHGPQDACVFEVRPL